MIELMNLVQSMDSKKLEQATKQYFGKAVNVKPLLNFVADKTNTSRPAMGAYWSAGNAANVIGFSRTNYYKMRNASEALGLMLVIEKEVDAGERGKPALLVLTYGLLHFADPILYDKLTGLDRTLKGDTDLFKHVLPAPWVPSVPEGYGDRTQRVRIPYSVGTEWVPVGYGDRTHGEAESEFESEVNLNGIEREERASSSISSKLNTKSKATATPTSKAQVNTRPANENQSGKVAPAAPPSWHQFERGKIGKRKFCAVCGKSHMAGNHTKPYEAPATEPAPKTKFPALVDDPEIIFKQSLAALEDELSSTMREDI